MPFQLLVLMGCRHGAVVRALASHQCVPGSIRRLGVICGLSLSVLYSPPRAFTPGTPVVPSQQKSTFDLIWFHCNVCLIIEVSNLLTQALERLFHHENGPDASIRRSANTSGRITFFHFPCACDSAWVVSKLDVTQAVMFVYWKRPVPDPTRNAAW